MRRRQACRWPGDDSVGSRRRRERTGRRRPGWERRRIPDASELVSRMLDMAAVTPEDYVIISAQAMAIVIAAAKRARACIEYDARSSSLETDSRKRARQLKRRCQADLLRAIFTRDGLTMFLLSDIMRNCGDHLDMAGRRGQFVRHGGIGARTYRAPKRASAGARRTCGSFPPRWRARGGSRKPFHAGCRTFPARSPRGSVGPGGLGGARRAITFAAALQRSHR